ncbi:MAG: hypothetical protein D6806_00355, partial [Deltaproteobacteria bacterium]
AACFIQEQAHEEANIIFGAVVDESMGDELKVTVIATGFDRARESAAEPVSVASQVPENLDIPTHIRKSSVRYRELVSAPSPEPPRAGYGRAQAPVAQKQPAQTQIAGYSSAEPEDVYDVPTFMRKLDR